MAVDLSNLRKGIVNVFLTYFNLTRLLFYCYFFIIYLSFFFEFCFSPPPSAEGSSPFFLIAIPEEGKREKRVVAKRESMQWRKTHYKKKPSSLPQLIRSVAFAQSMLQLSVSHRSLHLWINL